MRSPTNAALVDMDGMLFNTPYGQYCGTMVRKSRYGMLTKLAHRDVLPYALITNRFGYSIRCPVASHARHIARVTFDMSTA